MSHNSSILNSISNESNPPPTPDSCSRETDDTAFADSACTSNFLKINSHCVDKRPTSNGLRVQLPNGTIIQSTHTALLDLPQLPIEARRAHLFPSLHTSALISIGQLCDCDFVARFTKHDVTILDGENVILQGKR
jgi:hypothetical protein